jgi:methylenetetrahydrofolate--tRNA-(uracil-5-)-methyltransferase
MNLLKDANGNTIISVVGAGLAGSECALQLASMGYTVHLYEMRGEKQTPAHKTTDCAELVCSNSFGSLSDGSAPQQLKWEAHRLNSKILEASKIARVPAGQALGLDRSQFASQVTQLIRQNPRITLITKVVTNIDEVPRPTVIATGPLTDDQLSNSIMNHFGSEFCYFFDAIAPIIAADSIDTEIAWKADRYDKGSPDYFNCPLNKDEYNTLIQEIAKANKVEPKHFETTEFFEGCMPIEVMVDRGYQTLRFGPMKPVGLKNPKTGRDAWAIVQLRQDNKEGTAFNMVGFQTRMTYSEQVRVFRMIPGLQNAEFLKLGSIHRNMFINSPTLLNADLSSKKDSLLFFAGQITGVEGYFESTSIGLLVAKFIDQKLCDKITSLPPRSTAMGSLLNAITDESRAKYFQPTNINFGLLPPLEVEIKDKKQRKVQQIANARKAFRDWISEQNWSENPSLWENDFPLVSEISSISTPPLSV